jgi:hypothetical protein
MKRAPSYNLRLLLTVSLLAAGAGCTGPQSRILPVCPGKANVQQALAALAAHAEQAVSFRVSGGRCLLTYHDPDTGKQERHNLFLKLWFNPPREMYIQGSVAADPKAVIIGSNDERFWLSLRPKEISGYYEGQWSQVHGFGGLIMSPRVLLEAFGIIVSTEDELKTRVWSLKNRGAFDILTRYGEAGRPTQRVYVFACDYRVLKIEYVNEAGAVVARTEMGDYKPVAEGFFLPTEIKVTIAGPDGTEDSMEIELNSVKAMEFTQQQRDFMFVPRGRERAEHIYEYRNGQWVPQY